MSRRHRHKRGKTDTSIPIHPMRAHTAREVHKIVNPPPTREEIAEGVTHMSHASPSNTPLSPVQRVTQMVHLKLELGLCLNPPRMSKVEALDLEDRLRLFHTVACMSDFDWPYTMMDWSGGNPGLTIEELETIQETKICNVCGGRVYNNPDLSPPEIIKMVWQSGLYIVKMVSVKEGECLIKGLEREKAKLAGSNHSKVVYAGGSILGL
jgi:hypothetical protein